MKSSLCRETLAPMVHAGASPTAQSRWSRVLLLCRGLALLSVTSAWVSLSQPRCPWAERMPSRPRRAGASLGAPRWQLRSASGAAAVQPQRATHHGAPRTVFQTNTSAWLDGSVELELPARFNVITSLPDISEIGTRRRRLAPEEYERWFVDSVRGILGIIPEDSVAIFYQTPGRTTGVDGEWLDKGLLCQLGARAAGARCVWQKVILDGPPGILHIREHIRAQHANTNIHTHTHTQAFCVQAALVSSICCASARLTDYPEGANARSKPLMCCIAAAWPTKRQEYAYRHTCSIPMCVWSLSPPLSLSLSILCAPE